MAGRPNNLGDIWDPCSLWTQNILSFLSLADIKSLSGVDNSRHTDTSRLIGGKIIEQQYRIQWILFSEPLEADPNLNALNIQGWADLSSRLTPQNIAEDEYVAKQSSVGTISAAKTVIDSLARWLPTFEVAVRTWNERYFGQPFTGLVAAIVEATAVQQAAIVEVQSELRDFKDSVLAGNRRKTLITKAKQVWQTMTQVIGWIRPFITRALTVLESSEPYKKYCAKYSVVQIGMQRPVTPPPFDWTEKSYTDAINDMNTAVRQINGR